MGSPDGNGDCLPILVVEDDEDLAGLVRLRLEAEGFVVRVAHSTADAEAALVETSPLVMLLDLVLANEDGRDLIEVLDRRGEMPPFVVMTARGNERIAVDMMRRGARDETHNHHQPYIRNLSHVNTPVFGCRTADRRDICYL